jgi:cytochrome P450
MSVSERVLRLSPRIRRPVGAALVRLPAPGAKLLAFVASPAVRAEPWALYRALREQAPVYRTRFGATILSRHADALTVLRRPGTSVDESRATAFSGYPREGPYSELMRRTLLVTDPPDHERLRRLVAKAFTPGRVRRLQPHIDELVARRVDRVAGAGGTDVIAEIAYPLPVEVICELLGVPADDHRRLILWAADLASRLDIQPVRSPEVERAGDVAAAALTGYLHDLIEDPTRRVAGGLIDGLLEAEDEGTRLSRDEVIATCALVLLAGFETTANLVSNGLLALFDDPAQRKRLEAGDVPMTVAVEELLRYVGPVQMTQRVLLDDLELDGTVLGHGELVVTLIAAANRDPAVFSDPDDLDLGRAPNPHVAFSTGIHACLGASLARLETGSIIGHLLERFPQLRLARRPEWRDTFILRGLTCLPVVWT